MNDYTRYTHMKLSLALLVILSSFSQWLAAEQIDQRQSYARSTMECLVVNDFYAVHFTAIQQTERNGNNPPFATYCQEIPEAGKTFLTIDLLDRDVRATPVSLQVVEEEAGGDGVKPKVIRVLSEVPAKVYKNGTAETSLIIDKPGHYALIATFGEDMVTEDDRLHVPFSVGIPAAMSFSYLFQQFAKGMVLLFFLVMAFIGYRTFKSKNHDPVPANEATNPGEVEAG